MENSNTTHIPKVSVIVPVYNTEKYLAKCLGSIINQTLKDIEIIVLNDGSPDESDRIILDFMALDNRMHYLKHDNMGLGMTRNRGMGRANGEYLSFIDSDDYIEAEMLELMYAKAKKENLDVVVCETFIEDGVENSIVYEFEETPPYDLSGIEDEVFIKKAFLNNKYRYCAWNKLYKRSFVSHNKLLFGDGNVYAEDLFFQYHLLLCKPVINFLPMPFYHYMQREDSITSAIRNKYMERHLHMVNLFYKTNLKQLASVNKMIDSILFRGLLNEAGYTIKHKVGFSAFRISMGIFYKNPAYEKFMESVCANKSYTIIPSNKRRSLFRVFTLLQRIRLRYISECLIYLKQKFI